LKLNEGRWTASASSIIVGSAFDFSGRLLPLTGSWIIRLAGVVCRRPLLTDKLRSTELASLLKPLTEPSLSTLMDSSLFLTAMALIPKGRRLFSDWLRSKTS
jgi:hypothetical protein